MRIKNLSAAKIVEIKRDLAEVINRHSLENGSDTPDFVLADVAFYSLAVFEEAIHKRDAYYGALPEEVDPGEMDGDTATALASAGMGTDEDYGGDCERI